MDGTTAPGTHRRHADYNDDDDDNDNDDDDDRDDDDDDDGRPGGTGPERRQRPLPALGLIGVSHVAFLATEFILATDVH